MLLKRLTYMNGNRRRGEKQYLQVSKTQVHMVQKGIDDIYYSRTWTHRVEQQKEVMQLMLHSSIQGFVELRWYFGWELLFNQFKL